MASDGNPGKIQVVSLVQGGQAAQTGQHSSGGGNGLPQGGKSAAQATATAAAADRPVQPGTALATAAGAVSTPQAASKKLVVPPTTDPQALVEHLNKFLNQSGRPDQFRLDPASGGKLIQQINPDNGAVIGEFSATEFPALARSVGVAGMLVDSLA